MTITTVEIKERRERVTNNGMEIQRKFYVEPYTAKQELIAALLGTVEADPGHPSDATYWKRNLPCPDSYYAFCYCTETALDEQHPLAMSGAKSLGVTSSMTPAQLIERLSIAEKAYGAGPDVDLGAYIWATFKPVRYAVPPIAVGDPQAWNSSRYSSFDLINPTLTPFAKTASVGKNLKFTVTDYTLDLDVLPFGSLDSDAFITQSFSEFTVERRMVRNPPRELIAKFKGKVNEEKFSLGGPYVFEAQTLRFDDADIQPRVSIDATGAPNIWYDIVYHFTYNSIYARYWNGSGFTTGYVTWNRVLGCPMSGLPLLSSWMPIQLLPGGSDFEYAAFTSYYPVGWKEATFATGGVKRLYQTDHETVSEMDFRHLFYQGVA